MKFAYAALFGLVGAFDQDTEMAFISYISEHNKSYGTREEYQFRLAEFAKKVNYMREHNSRNDDGHKVELNNMSDWTDAEYKRLLGYRANLKVKTQTPSNATAEPRADGIDWRTKGAVTPVKNQGQCGSCWAFSSTGALEGAYQIKSGSLTSMSEQQLVDCSTAQGNGGCQGGLMDFAFTYLETNAIETEASYPYQGKDLTCRASSGTAVTKDTGFTDVKEKSPSALLAAIELGPVSIAVDAASLGWQMYSSGIVKYFCGTSLDHGVLLAGYGTDNGTDYWLVKNSWGAGWGEKGYIRLLRSSTEGKPGMCGLQLSASYPLL